MAAASLTSPAYRARSAAALAAAVVLAGAGACAHAGAHAAGELAEVRAAVAAANAEFAAALVRGDARAMAAVFAEDGQLLPATQRGFVSGRKEIEAYQARRLEAWRYLDATITTVDLGASGDLAWEIGTSRVTVQQGKNAAMTVSGRYLAVWKREADGRWLIRAELPVADPSP